MMRLKPKYAAALGIWAAILATFEIGQFATKSVVLILVGLDLAAIVAFCVWQVRQWRSAKR